MSPLPNPGMDFTAFDTLPAASLDDLVENIEALADGSGITWPLQNWTPTWSNVTIGNATVTGKYLRIDKLVIAWLTVIWGNTTSASGNIGFSLPVTSAAVAGTANVHYIGLGTMYDASGLVYDVNVTHVSTALAGVVAKAANGTWVTNSSAAHNAPVTWTNTDEWSFTLFYKAA